MKSGVGNWVRGGLIGAGASGTVNLAISKSNGHLFAVKSTASSISSLENQYRILQSLDSPHVVSYLGQDYTIENGVWLYNLFMEYVPGGSIGDLLHKFGGRLDESIIRSYTRGILLGIQYLHRQGIVHCDIKGKNVLVGANGVKLADFGSARRIGDEGESKQSLKLRGTPLWMAPEVVNQVEQGPASDIWSLGCTVLEMATGRHPWSQVSNPVAAMYRIGCTDELPELPASLSLRIQDFLEKCLTRDPRKRWTSEQLLRHPFLNEDTPVLEVGSLNPPQSPISPLDFDGAEQEWDSYSSASGPQICPTLPKNVPICPLFALSANLPTLRQAGECGGQGMKAFEQCQSPSPRDRILRLAAECESSSIAERPNWFSSPPGEWIVVRSPKRRTSPNLDGPFSGLTNRSSSKGFTSIQPQDDECNSISKPNDYAPDSTLELHLCSRVVGQFSSAPTVEQAKRLNKDSDSDTNSCKMPISFLQSCGSYRQLFIYTQMGEDHDPSFFINRNRCFVKTED